MASVRQKGTVEGASGSGRPVRAAARWRGSRMVFQRFSSESRHTPVVAANGNPPPYSHDIATAFRHVLAKSVCSVMPLQPRFFAPFAPLCGKSSQVLIHEQITTKFRHFRSSLIKLYSNDATSCNEPNRALECRNNSQVVKFNHPALQANRPSCPSCPPSPPPPPLSQSNPIKPNRT